MPALFQHRLRPLPEIIATYEALNFDVRRYLSGWFWLSDGWYWLSTTDGAVPLGHPAFIAHHELPEDAVVGIDYQVARLWIDLQDVLPAALTSLPEPFSRWVTTGAWTRWERDVRRWWRALDDEDRRSSDQTADALFTAKRWWNARHLDMGYLAAPPDVRFWRVGDTVTLEWDTRGRLLDGVPCWVETAGRQHFSLEFFEREVAAFRDRLDADMQGRLREVAAHGVLDAQQLANLQRQHDTTIGEQGREEVADWEEAEAAVAHVVTVSNIRVE